VLRERIDAGPSPSAKPAAFALQAPQARATSTPQSPGRFKLEVMLDQASHDKLEQLQALLRHQVPNGDLGRVVEHALDVLFEQTMKRRFAQTKVKTKSPPKPRAVRSRRVRSRYIPRAVVREVYARDGGRCSFVSSDGMRCGTRAFLELHHHDAPFARGGEATSENLRLMCRAHNALLAARDYGRDYMRAKVSGPSSGVDRPRA
jgi:hypothetical protein